MSNCVPVVSSAAPATAQQVRDYIDALRLAREQRAAQAARAAARAQSLVTPVAAPGAVLEIGQQSTTLTFPLSDPGAGAFTAAFTPTGVRLTARLAHGDISVVAPADIALVGVRADDPTAATLYMEGHNLLHIGIPATLVVVVTFHGVGGISGATIELPRADVMTLADPALDLAGVAYSARTYREGDVVARVGSAARLTHIDISTRWYRQDGVELPSGYPSALRGWKSAAQLTNYGISPPPQPVVTQVATAYQTNPRAPYGYSWQTCRPAGWPADGPHVATAESSSAFLAVAIEQAVQLLSAKYPQLAGIPNFAQEATAILDAVAIQEGSGRLWLPQNEFDIRPRQGDGLTARHRLDEGPHPRRFKWHVVDSAYRAPDSAAIVSPIGPFQMTVDTFRGEYDRRVRDGTFVGSEHTVGRFADKWLWDAPIEYQMLLPALKLIEETYLPTSPAALGGRLFPPIYRALAIYAINALNSVGRNFVAEAVLAAIALPATATSTELHIACKTVWDSGTGAAGTWAFFPGFRQKHANMLAGIGQKLALGGSGLPTRQPALFQVPPGGLPAPRARR